jgi:hypothetical protein
MPFAPSLSHHHFYVVWLPFPANWWLKTPLTNMKVRSDHHPQSGWGSHKIHVPNHQPVSELVIKDLKILRLVIQRYPKYHKISELVIQRLDFTKKIWGNPTDLTLSRIRSKDIQSTVPSGKLT